MFHKVGPWSFGPSQSDEISRTHPGPVETQSLALTDANQLVTGHHCYCRHLCVLLAPFALRPRDDQAQLPLCWPLVLLNLDPGPLRL